LLKATKSANKWLDNCPVLGTKQERSKLSLVSTVFFLPQPDKIATPSCFSLYKEQSLRRARETTAAYKSSDETMLDAAISYLQSHDRKAVEYIYISS